MGLPWWLGGRASASSSGSALPTSSPAEAVREHGVEHDLERVSDLILEIEREEQSTEPSGPVPAASVPPEAPEQAAAGPRRLGFWRGGMRSSGGGYGKRVEASSLTDSDGGAVEGGAGDAAASDGAPGASAPVPAPAPVGSVIPLGPTDPRPFPPVARDAALLTAGMLLVGASTVFYRRKMTRPFKAAYFLAWPVLGSAVVLNASPDPSRVRDEVEAEGQGARREEAQKHARAQMEALRRIAQDQ